MEKDTGPGPLTLVHWILSPAGTGNPSSSTAPPKPISRGNRTLRSGPASTRGARFTGERAEGSNGNIWYSSAELSNGMAPMSRDNLESGSSPRGGWDGTAIPESLAGLNAPRKKSIMLDLSEAGVSSQTGKLGSTIWRCH